MSQELGTLLRRFLSSRDLAAPDGRPLCLYRVEEEEFQELARALRAAGRRGEWGAGRSHFAACFCLVAAEWWRRNHAGGPWKWDGVLEEAGLPPDLDRPRIYPVVRDGLRCWRRPLLQGTAGNLYLVTLACEGGLPLNLIHQQGTALRTYGVAPVSWTVCG